MTTTTVVMLLLMGCGGGFLAGLLGVGGGMVLVPFLVMIFDHAGHDPAMVVQTALATALATIMFTSLSSMRAHHRKGAVQWHLVWLLAPGINRPHKNMALHTKKRGNRRRRYTVLPCTRLRNDTLLSHAPCEQCLPKCIVDFMGTRMQKIFAF